MKLKSGLLLMLLGFMMSSLPSFASQAKADSDMQFDLRYKAWKTWVQKYGDVLSDSTGTSIGLFAEIVKLGPSALPSIMEKMKEDPILVCAVIDITKKYFPPSARYNGMGWAEEAGLYLKWWYEDKDKNIRANFRQFYEKLKTPGLSSSDRKTAIESIRRLGIGVLPLLFEKIQAGDDELSEIAKYLTNNGYPVGSDSATLSRWWKSNLDKYVLPFPPD